MGSLQLCIAVLIVTALPVAAQSISFVDASETAGLTTAGVGHGVAVHDYDRDGWDDLFIATLSGRSTLFRNNGDTTFSDVTVDAGLGAIGAYAVALWGDVDRDGFVDLFLGRAASGASRLFRNRGDGTFEDVTAVSGIDPTLSVATAAFGDVDGDGAVDLFLAVHQKPDVLYLNSVDRSATLFEDVSTEASVGGPAHSVPMQVTWEDFDNDGDPDLFAVHDGRISSRLYRNDTSWPMRDVGFASGIHAYPSPDVCCNMGAAWGDFDGDGWMDVYVTRIGKGGLFRNNGDGTFIDEAEDRGAARNGMSWGVVWLDADNDGDLDLFIVGTSGYDGTPTLLYENEAGTFTEIGRGAGASLRIDARGLASGDFNGDGLIDLVIVSTNGRHRLLLNATENAGHWVKVNLRGQDVDAGAVGTRVEVVAAGKTHVRTVSGGDSYASQSSATMHVGLGAADRIDTLRIRWRPDRLEELTDLEVDRSFTVTEGTVTHARHRRETVHTDFALGGVYPNPARNVMHVGFDVPDAGRVHIDIHDPLGRRVAVVGDAFLHPGPHIKVVDVGALPSGAYFIRLEAGGRVLVRGIVVSR